MTLICEECGKIYHIAPEKISQLKGKNTKLKCKECGHVFTISGSDSETLPSAQPIKNLDDSSTDDDGIMDLSEEVVESPEPLPQSEVQTKEQPKKEKASKDRTMAVTSIETKGLGLRGKMIILFLIVPITLMAASGFFAQNQINILANEITAESASAVQHLAEDNIATIARAVALQCKIYLSSHPDLTKEDFNYDMTFKRIAVQKVGLTGYTALFETPETEGGKFRTWAHVNPKIIGGDMEAIIKNALGKHFPEFWDIIKGSQGMRESRGYYTWREKDGTLRQKYMVVAPVPNTNFVIAATTYMDEFTSKTRSLETRSKKLVNTTRTITLSMLIGTLIFIILTITIYGHRITSNIKHLTDVADRISVGELDAKIVISSKDEIGNLADAISRMQDSLRLSLERLRRRR